MKMRAGFVVMLLTLAASVVVLGGQPLGDRSTSVKIAPPPPAGAVSPAGSIQGQGAEASPEIVLPLLWDNGDTDGSNGYSHAPASAFGYRRALLDDFVVPVGVNWSITGFSWLMIWDSGSTGLGTGAEIIFHADAAGTPGPVVATAVVTNWSETATGRSWFGRAEETAQAMFNTITLGTGRYWVEYLPLGPENSYGMIRSGITGYECWVNYADFAGLQPGSSVFEVSADLSWMLLGTSASAFDGTFYDDTGRSIFCVSFKTGDYQWSILSGPGAGMTYTGRAQVLNANQKVVSFPGAADSLNFTFDKLRKKAQGYFIGSQGAPAKSLAPQGYYSTLYDKNTADDPAGCRGTEPTVPDLH